MSSSVGYLLILILQLMLQMQEIHSHIIEFLQGPRGRKHIQQTDDLQEHRKMISRKAVGSHSTHQVCGGKRTGSKSSSTGVRGLAYPCISVLDLLTSFLLRDWGCGGFVFKFKICSICRQASKLCPNCRQLRMQLVGCLSGTGP